MALALVNSQNLRTVTLQNQSVPDQIVGVQVQLDFTAANPYIIDFTSYEWQGRINLIQTLFIDMSNSGVPIDILELSTQHDIVANAHTQGFYSFLAANPTKVQVNCPGGPNNVVLFFLNTPIPGAVWAANHP